MANRRAIGMLAAAGVLVGSAVVAPVFGAPAHRAGVSFSKVYVDKQLAGGEPIVYYDPVHQDFIYSSHEGTTHTLHDGLVQAPAGTADMLSNYRNQVNIWTSRNGVHWNRVNWMGTGFMTDPSKNTGFSDPDLTQDDGGRIYNTGIDLANDALFSSADGGVTWDRGTVNCHEGDRPWLAGAHKNEVFLATDPESEPGHTIYRSTDGGSSCSAFGIGDYGPGYSGFGKLYYNRFDGSLVEPVIYGNNSGIGVGILPHASHAFAKQKGKFHAIRIADTDGLLTHFPGMSVDRKGNIYLTWVDDPSNGKNSIYFAMLNHAGKVLVKPQVVSHPGTTVLWPWVVSGAPGNAAIVWYQYDRAVAGGGNGVDTTTSGKVFVYEATLRNELGRHGSKTVVNASGRPVHEGGICQGGTTCVATGQDRRLGDYLTDNLDAHGCVIIATGDTMKTDPVTGKQMAWSLPLFMHQQSGPSLTHGTCRKK